MGLIIIQMLGVLAGAVAAVIDIESIVFSGPLLSLTGIIIAARSFRRDRALGFYLGMAAPTMTVACFSLIFGLVWSPRVAQVPVASLITVFAILHTPLGVVALREVRRTGHQPRRPMQFSILTLLVLMLVLSIVLGVVRSQNAGVIALMISVACSVGAGYLLWRFQAGRLPREESGCQDAARDWQI